MRSSIAAIMIILLSSCNQKARSPNVDSDDSTVPPVATSDSCERAVGVWRGGGFGANISKQGDMYLLQFVQSTGVYPFLVKCEDGTFKTGSWPGDGTYSATNDHFYMEGAEMIRR
jgi:hypothetical protein